MKLLLFVLHLILVAPAQVFAWQVIGSGEVAGGTGLNSCVGYSTSCTSFGNPSVTAVINSDRTSVTDWTANEAGVAKKIHLYVTSITDGDGAIFRAVLYKQTGGVGNFVLQTYATYTPIVGWNTIDISSANISFSVGDVLYFGQATDETAAIDLSFGRDVDAATHYWYQNVGLPDPYVAAGSGLYRFGAVLEYAP